MKYHELVTSPAKKPKRLGRGISAGQGKTAGRGTKGQKSRTGYSKKPGFEGGQNPLMQKLPKLPGFKSHRTQPEIVKTGELELVKSRAIDAQLLANNNLISNPYVSVKVILGGDISSPKTVKLPNASQSAIEAINKAGGSFEKVERLKQPKKTSDSKA